MFERSLIKMSWKLTLNDVKLLSSQTRPSSVGFLIENLAGLTSFSRVPSLTRR